MIGYAVNKNNRFSWRIVSSESQITADEIFQTIKPLSLPEEALCFNNVQEWASVLDVDELKIQLCKAINTYANLLRNKITEDISSAEMASWSIKLKEALSFQADSTANCPMLSVESASRNIPLDVLVAKVLEKSNLFSYLEATISGTAGRHCDSIKNSSQPELYDWSVGWPNLV